jgi:hypothetical protein
MLAEVGQVMALVLLVQVVLVAVEMETLILVQLALMALPTRVVAEVAVLILEQLKIHQVELGKAAALAS